MTEAEFIKKLVRDYGISVNGHHLVINLASLPSIIMTVKNYLKGKDEV